MGHRLELVVDEELRSHGDETWKENGRRERDRDRVGVSGSNSYREQRNKPKLCKHCSNTGSHSQNIDHKVPTCICIKEWFRSNPW